MGSTVTEMLFSSSLSSSVHHCQLKGVCSFLPQVGQLQGSSTEAPDTQTGNIIVKSPSTESDIPPELEISAILEQSYDPFSTPGPRSQNTDHTQFWQAGQET